MTRTRFTTLAALLLAALLLSGCGGGGGGGGSSLQDQIDMLTMERDDAQDEVTSLKDEVTRLEGELTTAENRVTQLETLIGDAVNPASASLRGQLADAQAEAARLRGELTAAQGQVSEAEQRVSEAEAEAERRVEEAEQQANVSLLAQPFITPLGAATRRGDGDDHVQWTRGNSLMVNPTGGSFTRGSAAPSVSGLRGFTGFSFTRQSGTATAVNNETAYIYTNIQAPGNKAFWKKYGLEEVLSADNEGMARASGTAQATTADGTTTTRLSGSFDGAGGTFACDGDCTAAVTVTNGVPDFDTPSSWTFTPGSPTTSVTLNQDEEFLYFGIWSSVPNVVTASPTVNFQVIHGGSQPFTAVDTLSGQFNFSGGAIGRYAITPQVGQKARVGTFTADASLTAVMGANPTIGGSITNFRENDESLSGWRVTLGDNAGAAVAFTGGTVTSTDGATASIGGVPATGAWSATLYGSNNDPTDELADTNVYPAARYPEADLAGVAGQFEAATANNTAAIAGAFAAAP